ncbi:unnamed protein product [Trifolium pratense]|uniref:Uncharacterized protein n=1 Tax=Trifolium pratense TaxID=57577 RepID=A0ACB0IPC0_TRIPR|nr:unnamed protein product [Trifolium pratense]
MIGSSTLGNLLTIHAVTLVLILLVESGTGFKSLTPSKSKPLTRSSIIPIPNRQICDKSQILCRDSFVLRPPICDSSSFYVLRASLVGPILQ